MWTYIQYNMYIIDIFQTFLICRSFGKIQKGEPLANISVQVKFIFTDNVRIVC